MILRDYQIKFLSGIYQKHREGNQGVIGDMPTGAGKTVCMARIALSMANSGGRLLIVVHRSELMMQTADKLQLFGVQFGIISAKSANPRPFAAVQIAMVQTLARRIKKNIINEKFNYIIFDEAHLAAANSYKTIIDRWPNAKRLGLSATPWRLDGRGLSDVGTAVVKGPSVSDLIEIGSLVPFTTYSPSVVNLSKIKKVAGEFDLESQAKLYKKADVIGDVIEHYMSLAKGRPFIAFCSSVEHSIMVMERFEDIGIRVEQIDGSTPIDKRNASIAKLAGGTIQGITNCGCLTEGFDCPIVSCVMIIRKTASSSLWRQMGGRGLRPHNRKKDCVILDFGANAETHGNFGYVYEYTLDGKPKMPKDRLCRICPKCAGVCIITAKVCDVCGYDFSFVDSKEREIIEAEGILEAIEFDKKPDTRHKFMKKSEREELISKMFDSLGIQ